MNVSKNLLIALVATTTLLMSSAGFAKRPSEQTTIVDVALAENAKSGEYATLLAAATEFPPIVEYLEARGQRTLFAPTNQAFTDLENEVLGLFCYDNVGHLLDMQPDYVADVLLYHVAKGRKDSAEVLPADQIRMLSGDFVTREPYTTVITDALNYDANLTKIDVPADNGVIHEIDSVLLPYTPESNCPPE